MEMKCEKAFCIHEDLDGDTGAETALLNRATNKRETCVCALACVFSLRLLFKQSLVNLPLHLYPHHGDACGGCPAESSLLDTAVSVFTSVCLGFGSLTNRLPFQSFKLNFCSILLQCLINKFPSKFML